MRLGLVSEPVESFRKEYGDLTVGIEVVMSLQAAVDHINTYSRCKIHLHQSVLSIASHL